MTQKISKRSLTKLIGGVIFVLFFCALGGSIFLFYKVNPQVIGGYFVPLYSEELIDLLINWVFLLPLLFGSLGVIIIKRWGWFLLQFAFVLNISQSFFAVIIYGGSESLFLLIINVLIFGALLLYFSRPKVISLFNLKEKRLNIYFLYVWLFGIILSFGISII